MPDPKHVRLNDSDDPDRTTKFEQALKRSASSGNQVLRQLVDAYNRYVAAHGRGPIFPVDLVSSSPKQMTAAEAAQPEKLYHAWADERKSGKHLKVIKGDSRRQSSDPRAAHGDASSR